MTILQIKNFVESVDPEAKHYFTTLDGNGYTVWAETERTGIRANNALAERGWKFRIIRYTRDEFEAVAETIERALDASDVIDYAYTVDCDPESRYIMHIFECEA